MDKNAISFLQEYMQSKKQDMPIYTCISEKKNDNSSLFTVRVQCNNIFLEANGNSKKEAKYNAALKMLISLNINSTNDNNVYDVNSYCNQNSTSSKENYIGKLQELVVSRNPYNLPQYKFGPQCGSGHKPVFTVTCTYENFKEEASGNCKKSAKMIVAKKMFERLSEIKNSTRDITSRLKLYETNQRLKQNSINTVLEIYKQLNKTANTVTVLDSNVVNHLSKNEGRMIFLKKICPIDKYESIITTLDKAIKICDNSIEFGNENPMLLLKAVLNILNIKMIQFTCNSKTDFKITGLKLKTNPIISEIGYAKNQSDAEKLAVIQMVKTVRLMLI